MKIRMTPQQHRDLALKQLEITERAGGIRAFFDGCCEPKNPGGTAGYGAVMFRGDERIWEHSGFVEPGPTTSNNVAEYLAVNAIFDKLLEMSGGAAACDGRSAMIFGDSRLVICQLWGWPRGAKKWAINGVDRPAQPKGHYADSAVAAREKLARLGPTVQGFWIPRDKNDVADDLSKAHLRRLGVEFRIQPEEKTDA